MWPRVKLVNAANGTMVSLVVLSDAPVEASDLPVLAIELLAWLRTAFIFVFVPPVLLSLFAGVDADRDLATTDKRLVPAVPGGSDPPEVLTQISLSVSGFCQ